MRETAPFNSPFPALWAGVECTVNRVGQHYLDQCQKSGHRERISDLERMLMFLRRHVSNPELNPQALANHMRISVRTVHKRFEEANTTFRQWLLDERLDTSRRALADPRCNDMTVAQIAYSLGFNDLSHFTKTFRARFGVPPGRFRKQA